MCIRDSYIRVSIDDRRYWAHRLAWLYVHGTWPPRGLDHRDENKANNAIANLRPADKSQNGQNVTAARSSSKSGLLGASPDGSGRWQASITVNRKQRNLGRYDTAEEAHAVYLAAKALVHPFRHRQSAS